MAAAAESGGVKPLGANRFADARAASVEALALDPDLALAEQALLDVPEQLITLQQIQADVTAPAR